MTAMMAPQNIRISTIQIVHLSELPTPESSCRQARTDAVALAGLRRGSRRGYRAEATAFTSRASVSLTSLTSGHSFAARSGRSGTFNERHAQAAAP
jgi:hypothetical protein